MKVEIKHEIFIKDKITEYYLYIENKNVGCVGINKNNYITVSNINKKYRGRGYGKLLYETILKERKEINTKYNSISNDAQNVWKSLIKKYKYNTDFFNDILTVYYNK